MIKIGEYIRCKDGKMGIYKGEPEDCIRSYDYFGNIKCFSKDIKSHSFNIIDLIEVRRLC